MFPSPLCRLAALFLLAATLPAAQASPEKAPVQVRIEHQTRQVEGWTVHVDVSLLDGKYQKMGELALKVLGERLHQICLRLPEGPVAEMKKVPIYLDRRHPLGNAHYHPDVEWLEEQGYDPAMAKAVQFTASIGLINQSKRPNGGSVVLHELAHAYHDRVLSFDHPEILAAYRQFCDTGKFEQADHVSGRIQPHYGLTDHKEYFAEMTETFFVGNDYRPFTHYDLYHEHRPSYLMLQRLWGTDITPPVKSVPERSILDLRILANLRAQNGDFKAAYELLDEAEARSDDREGRLAELRKKIAQLEAGSRED